MHTITSAVVLKILSMRECYATVMRLTLGDVSFKILVVPANLLSYTCPASVVKPIVNLSNSNQI